MSKETTNHWTEADLNAMAFRTAVLIAGTQDINEGANSIVQLCKSYGRGVALQFAEMSLEKAKEF